jgi:hypothetical protein
MLIFLAGCAQIYLRLRMSFLGFANLFFYGILFLTFTLLVIGAYKKKNMFVFISIFFMFPFMSVKLRFKRIENFYFDRSVSNGNIIKTDLKRYYSNYKEYPQSLDELYKNSKAPKYNMGFFEYDFTYRRTDTSYKLYFNHFDGRMFVNYGESEVWNFYD